MCGGGGRALGLLSRRAGFGRELEPGAAGLGLRAQGLGFRVQGLGFEVQRV